MAIKCSICGIENADSDSYCRDCGNMLTANPVPVPEPAPAPAPAPAAAPAPQPEPAAPGAKLFVKRYGAVSGEGIPLAADRLVIGRFDPSAGPVDLDVTGMPGAEHVSRRHAEVYAQAGLWFVRDLGSTNGLFLRRAGESGFSPRLQEPAELHDGDEVAVGNLVLVFRAS